MKSVFLSAFVVTVLWVVSGYAGRYDSPKNLNRPKQVGARRSPLPPHDYSAMAHQLRPCDNITNKQFPFCNTNLTLEARVEDLIYRISSKSASTLMNTGSGNVTQEDLYLPSYNWWSEGLHGVANSQGVNYNGPSKNTTSFPQVCLTGATFNKTLFKAIGNVVGIEGRAMHNDHQAGLTYWAPNINIYRDPRWGRGQETPGEDVFLTSTYATHFVKSMQENEMDPGRLRVSSCCKHFAGYDVDNWGGQERYWFDAWISEYDLENTFLPCFEACYHKEGGAASGMMCSYNAVNGIPSCANKAFITDLAREKWGFNGYVTSDCGAIGDIGEPVGGGHNYSPSVPQTVHDVLTAGTDIDCGMLLQVDMDWALRNGNITYETMYTALRHQFMVKFRLGMFDPVETQPYKTLGADNVSTPEHEALALDAAREGVTLLYNKDNTLPLKLDDYANKTVLVMGPNANHSIMQLGNYYGDPPYIITPLQYVTELVGKDNVQFLEGLPGVTSQNAEMFRASCNAATSAAVTLLFVGNDQSVECEGTDRYDIGMPFLQQLWIDHVSSCAHAAGKKVIVTSFSGGSVDYTQTLNNPAVSGLLWAGYPGQSGGQAIAEIIFGITNPSGRLVQTVYPKDYVNTISPLDMQMEANETSGNPGRTYRYYTGKAVFPFGHGLSYSNITTRTLGATGQGVTADINEGEVTVLSVHAMEELVARNTPLFKLSAGVKSVEITNHGPYPAKTSVLMFLKKDPPTAEVGGQLTDFEKVFLEVGQSTTIDLSLNAHAFTRVIKGERKVVPGSYIYTIDAMGHKTVGKLVLK